MIRTLKDAIDHYGAKNQCMVAVEELAELQKEISKFARGYGKRDSIIEEIADAIIMIEQIKIMNSIQDPEIGEAIEFKIERLRKRIDERRKK